MESGDKEIRRALEGVVERLLNAGVFSLDHACEACVGSHVDRGDAKDFVCAKHAAKALLAALTPPEA